MSIESAFKSSPETEAFFQRLDKALSEVKAMKLGVELAPEGMTLRERWTENRKRRAEGRPELVPAEELRMLEWHRRATDEHKAELQRLADDPGYATKCGERMTAEIMEGYRTRMYHGD